MPARTRTNLMRRSLPFPLRTRRSLALIFLPGEKIENINDQYCTIPEEVKNLGPHDRLIRVYHFNRDPNQNQMITSLGSLVIKEGETLANVKICIQKKL
ncbi:ubiquitin C-terminal hydrolase 13-like isoform X1 [Zingiber officinale]|uniref:ubiquitin C-terminal hydrolase 13-like isoform X1 n=1 Tax=Zingiber officinale TaxID=94328 RepID=UPI001C4AA2A8|nr:ubiquitin C-terminal hydrolase 13-like isoform X1 [Zingiber officinale]